MNREPSGTRERIQSAMIRADNRLYWPSRWYLDKDTADFVFGVWRLAINAVAGDADAKRRLTKLAENNEL